MTRSVEEAWTALRDELARHLNVILLPAAVSRHLHRYQAAVRAQAFAEVRRAVEGIAWHFDAHDRAGHTSTASSIPYGEMAYIAARFAPPDWQALAMALREYGYWERTYGDLAAGVTHRLSARGYAAQRHLAVFGRRLAVSRDQRLLMCGLLMAMCLDDAEHAARGAVTFTQEER